MSHTQEAPAGNYFLHMYQFFYIGGYSKTVRFHCLVRIYLSLYLGLVSTWCSKKEVELHVKPNDIANVSITGIGGSRINAVIDNSLRDRVKRVRVSILTFEHPD